MVSLASQGHFQCRGQAWPQFTVSSAGLGAQTRHGNGRFHARLPRHFCGFGRVLSQIGAAELYDAPLPLPSSSREHRVNHGNSSRLDGYAHRQRTDRASVQNLETDAFRFCTKDPPFSVIFSTHKWK